MCFTLNKERRKNILFLSWPEISQRLHTTPKYLKLSAIEDDSTAITHIYSLLFLFFLFVFESYARHEQNY